MPKAATAAESHLRVPARQAQAAAAVLAVPVAHRVLVVLAVLAVPAGSVELAVHQVTPVAQPAVMPVVSASGSARASAWPVHWPETAVPVAPAEWPAQVAAWPPAARQTAAAPSCVAAAAVPAER